MGYQRNDGFFNMLIQFIFRVPRLRASKVVDFAVFTRLKVVKFFVFTKLKLVKFAVFTKLKVVQPLA